MNITRWEPFQEMESMLRQYSPFFGRALRREGGECVFRTNLTADSV